MEKHGVRIIGILLELFHLGEAIDVVTPFNFLDKKAHIAASVKPTLSPKDSKFQAWWAQHKSEWETPKKEGQEPSDR